jgi:hypothetical protein
MPGLTVSRSAGTSGIAGVSTDADLMPDDNASIERALFDAGASDFVSSR